MVLVSIPFIGLFIALVALPVILVLGSIPAGIYLIYHFLKPKRCPICNGKNFGPIER